MLPLRSIRLGRWFFRVKIITLVFRTGPDVALVSRFSGTYRTSLFRRGTVYALATPIVRHLGNVGAVDRVDPRHSIRPVHGSARRVEGDIKTGAEAHMRSLRSKHNRNSGPNSTGAGEPERQSKGADAKQSGPTGTIRRITCGSFPPALSFFSPELSTAPPPSFSPFSIDHCHHGMDALALIVV